MTSHIKVLGSEQSVEKPLNREPPVKELISNFITEEGGYDRNHGPILHLDGAFHTVNVDGAVKNHLSLSVDELSNSFPQHDVICALQCAGNRRHTMRTLQKEVDGLDWGDAAVMNCHWRGPRLRDVLLKAGLDLEGKDKLDIEGDSDWHVAFACYATKVQEDSWYGGSIPLDRGLSLDGDVILALEMNGAPLPDNHGAPVRIIAPGVAGARSVKWLERIIVQATESDNFYQYHDYKALPPKATNKEEANKYWHKTPALQDMPINSVIGSPQTGDAVKTDTYGKIEVSGYALPQGAGGPVVGVEVSVDEGKSWENAEILENPSKWSWALWKAHVAVQKGKNRRILSRTTDRSGNVQQDDSQWNLRGVAYNGYGEARDVEVV